MIWALVVLIGGLGCNVVTKATLEAPVATQISHNEAQLITHTALEERWESAAPGVDVRLMRVAAPFAESPFNMTVVRLDPAQVRFEVHYTPTDWYHFDKWREILDNPLLIVNASFFTPEGYAVGLVVANGDFYGQSLYGYGGMFQVIGDEARVRSLVAEPYTDAPYDHAAQGFPMLVEPGGTSASTGRGFDVPSRRTIIAQDTEGNILIMITVLGQMTLRNAQGWLLASGLDIDVAFGLDGGKSSGLFVQKAADAVYFPSFDPVPVVIAAYPLSQ